MRLQSLPSFRSVRLRLRWAVVVAILMAFSTRGASASTISGTYSVTGSGFVSLSTPPFSSIFQSFTITFDNSAAVSGQTSGITLNSSTITPASTLGFTYIPIIDTLIVGGTAATVAASDPTSVDFALVIGNASSLSNYNPVTLSYSAGRNAVYTATTVSRTQAAAVTPEPGSLALLGTGLLGLFGVARKRFV